MDPELFALTAQALRTMSVEEICLLLTGLPGIFGQAEQRQLAHALMNGCTKDVQDEIGECFFNIDAEIVR
jgi:hypothetical protein